MLPLPLVERSERAIAHMIRRKVEGLKGVKDVRQVTARVSGKRLDVNMLVSLQDEIEGEDPHKISLLIEREVMREFPDARVTINTGPVGNVQDNVWGLVKDIAEGTPGSRGVHNIHIQKIGKKVCVDLHLEVSANMTVKQAHDVADDVEKRIKEAYPDLGEITVHIESASERVSRELAGVETELESYIEHVAVTIPEIKSVYGIKVRRFGDVLHLVFQAQFSPNLNIAKAHEISNRLEKEIKGAFPNIGRIDIHEEPA
jgi:divalent metal cation (Fe/Co/Zn/Cd) transporter